jgi:hypothetical protein
MTATQARALAHYTQLASQADLLAALERANRVLAELAHSSYITGSDYASQDMRQRVKAAHEIAYAAIAQATREAA